MNLLEFTACKRRIFVFLESSIRFEHSLRSPKSAYERVALLYVLGALVAYRYIIRHSKVSFCVLNSHRNISSQIRRQQRSAVNAAVAPPEYSALRFSGAKRIERLRKIKRSSNGCTR